MACHVAFYTLCFTERDFLALNLHELLIALDHIEKGDILLLLGKGNEQFMKIKGEKVPFSEAECIKRYMASHKK